jgi:hypothetical protein
VGVLLAGIVFFNVDLLRLNHDIARTAERSSAVKRGNVRLRLELGQLSSSEWIQRAAGERGFVLPAPRDVRYLRAHPSADAARAAKRMNAQVPTQEAPPAPAAPTG